MPASDDERGRSAPHGGDGQTTRARIEPVDPALVASLSDPAAHPHDPTAPDGIESIQTHISHVFLTRERVYKLRKAVDLGFLSFATRAERNRDCEREVRLNRRLAPHVYLGVAPIEPTTRGHRVGIASDTVAATAVEPPEHCVVMRRLPAHRDALSLLERGRLRAGDVDRIADRIARFHADEGLGVPAPFTPEAWHERIAAPVRESLELLAARPEIVDADEVADCCERAEDFLSGHRDALETRRREGWAVDGHGDLHLQHVWFVDEDAEPIAIDCIEFREDLRRIDAAADVAFLAMDLRYRGAEGLAARFLRVYAAGRDDFGLYSVVDFYASYRAAVRAKVAALAATDPEIGPEQRQASASSARRHVGLARALLAQPGRGRLVLCCGLIGTGKSQVAAALADALDGVVVSSDRVRKQRAGMEVRERPTGGFGAGLYTPEARRGVYQALLERAAAPLAAGRVVILDASFSASARRADARALAARAGLPVELVEVWCDRETVLERLRARAAADRDPSDAGPELYDRFAQSFEVPDEWPARSHHRVDTSEPSWPSRVESIARIVARS